MTRRKKVSTRKNITRRRNTFNNCNFKGSNNMKDEQKWNLLWYMGKQLSHTEQVMVYSLIGVFNHGD